MLTRMSMSGAAKRELQPGETVGDYRLEEILGEGGMGLVFRASRISDGHEVALKVLKVDLADDRAVRFEPLLQLHPAGNAVVGHRLRL